jgi:hypothetical protein
VVEEASRGGLKRIQAICCTTLNRSGLTLVRQNRYLTFFFVYSPLRQSRGVEKKYFCKHDSAFACPERPRITRFSIYTFSLHAPLMDFQVDSQPRVIGGFSTRRGVVIVSVFLAL